MTSCWDYAVVICPGCGPHSYVRYCSKQHLYDDLQYHWLYHCGQHEITDPIDRSTIRPHQDLIRPYVVNNGHNLIERHRQAVYRSMEEGDFFIFDDAGVLGADFVEPTKEQWNTTRGTGPYVFQLIFPDDLTIQSRRLQFDYDIYMCLKFGAPFALDSCMTAVRLIRGSLILTANWTDKILDLLCLQLAGEWGGFRIPMCFYNVEEANDLWQTQGLLSQSP